MSLTSIRTQPERVPDFETSLGFLTVNLFIFNFIDIFIHIPFFFFISDTMVFSGVNQHALVPGCSNYCITLVTLSLEFSNSSINFPRKN